MYFKTYIALNVEVRISTQFGKQFKNLYEVRYINKKIRLLPVDWDKKGLLFTKLLLMMNKCIGYS